MASRKLSDFKPGDLVRYVPNHANGEPTHPDCENGVVKSVNDKYVFVNYIRNNVFQQTAAATEPDDLIKGHY